MIVYRRAARGRCQFVEPTGALSRPRSCKRPIEFTARGTSHWRLRLHISLAPGRYGIRSVAVDRLHHRQAGAASSLTSITIR